MLGLRKLGEISEDNFSDIFRFIGLNEAPKLSSLSKDFYELVQHIENRKGFISNLFKETLHQKLAKISCAKNFDKIELTLQETSKAIIHIPKTKNVDYEKFISIENCEGPKSYQEISYWVSYLACGSLVVCNLRSELTTTLKNLGSLNNTITSLLKNASITEIPWVLEHSLKYLIEKQASQEEIFFWIKNFKTHHASNVKLAQTIFSLVANSKMGTDLKMELLALCLTIDKKLLCNAFEIASEVLELPDKEKILHMNAYSLLFSACIEIDPTKGESTFEVVKKWGKLEAKKNVLVSWVKADPTQAPMIFKYLQDTLNPFYSYPIYVNKKAEIINTCLQSNPNIPDFFISTLKIIKNWNPGHRLRLFKLALGLTKSLLPLDTDFIFRFVHGLYTEEEKNEVLKNLFQFNPALALPIILEAKNWQTESLKFDFFLNVLATTPKLAKDIFHIAKEWGRLDLKTNIFIICVQSNNELKGEVLSEIKNWPMHCKKVVLHTCKSIKKKKN